jgi:hypothetical protein
MLLEPVMGVGAESAECDRRSGLKQTFGRLLWASGLCFVLWALVAPWAAVSMGKSHAAVGGWLLLVVLPPVMAFGRLQVRRARRRLLAKVAYSIQSLEPTFDELVLLVEYLRYRLDPILGATSVDQLRRLIHSAKPAKIRARARKLSRDEVRQEGERFSLWRASRLRMPAQVHEPDATAALSMGTADRCSEQL